MRKVLLGILLLFLSVHTPARAQDPILDSAIRQSLATFVHQVPGAREFLAKTEGYLVIPSLYKAGFFVGGQYGKGGLFVKTPDGTFRLAEYYELYSASLGLQFGAQKRSLIVAFLTKEALRKFRSKRSWKVGVNGSVTLIDIGTNVDLSTVEFDKSIVAIAYNNRGLMAGISLDGSVFKHLY